MDRIDSFCYKCGAPENREYNYFLIHRSPDKKKGLSFKSFLSRSATLTLGNLYPMILCDRCVKREYMRIVLMRLAVASVLLALVYTAAAIIWPSSIVYLSVGVLGALMIVDAFLLLRIAVKSKSAVTTREGERCASRFYNRDHHYAKDGVSAMAPAKANTKFGIK
jgi:hypothetical protein